MSTQAKPARWPPAAVAAADAIRQRWDRRPVAGLILGTGLGDLSTEVAGETSIPYREIPGFPDCTALGHAGQVVCGRIGNRQVILMDGRCHGYEGCSLEELMLPVFTMHALGVRLLVVSNASGGLNPRFDAGDIVVIDDHIDLMFLSSPARWNSIGTGSSPHAARHGCLRPTRWAWNGPSVSARGQYDPALVDQAIEVARRHDFVARRGVYVGVTGPNYETRAEYRFLRGLGGDVVGMSTIPEVTAAAACGIRTLALSTVTNVACPDRSQVVLAEHVVGAATRAQPHVWSVVVDVITNPPGTTEK